MAKIDLRGLSLKELQSLQSRIEKAIAREDKKAKANALTAVKAKAKEMGFSLAELTGEITEKPKRKKAKASKKPAKVAYRDSAGNTYAGRGPYPKWLKDALASGKKMEDFKV